MDVNIIGYWRVMAVALHKRMFCNGDLGFLLDLLQPISVVYIMHALIQNAVCAPSLMCAQGV